MLKDYEEDIEILITWYEKAKEVVIQAESMDSLNKVYIQPLNEQRYCLDHFIRAIVYEQDNNSKEIIKKALSSAIGHLQRAYSDSVEWILISVQEEYMNVLAQYTNEQINQGFPEYYSEIRPTFDKIRDVVNQYKINKSVEQATSIDILSDNMIKKLNISTGQFLSEDMVNVLKSYLLLLREKESILLEIKERDKKEGIKNKIIFPVITGTTAAVIAGIIIALIMG